MLDILDKIKAAELTGKGGAGFSVWKKWEAVKNVSFNKESQYKKFVICNASEGEPGVKKDYYILKHYADRVIHGMSLAMEYLEESKNIQVKGILYINAKYFQELGEMLKNLCYEKNIEIFVKPYDSGYIGGEESALLNTIEGFRTEPRLKPPFPVTKGLYGAPTLINNVETFYDVSLVFSGEYFKNRFYTIGGDVKNPGVFELPNHYHIERILKETNNFPNLPFFVQVGGNSSGEIFNYNQLQIQSAFGAGSLTVYLLGKYKPKILISNWIDFFLKESCGQCTVCREGTYRLKEIVSSPQPNWKMFRNLLDNLSNSSFCALGTSVSIPIKTYINNVLSQILELDLETKEIFLALKD